MSKKWQHQMRNWITKTMELPADVMLDLPRITLIGQLHIYIENHKGLLTFSENEVRILLKQGQLKITGEDFVIKTILTEEILLEGKIDNVVFLEL